MMYLSRRNFLGIIEGKKVYFTVGESYDFPSVPLEYLLKEWLVEVEGKEIVVEDNSELIIEQEIKPKRRRK